jgi:hypothetical protein
VDAMLRALVERPIDNSSSSSGSGASSGASSGDASGGSSGGSYGVCLGYRYGAVPPAYVDAALKRLMARIFSFSNLEAFFDMSEPTTDPSPALSPSPSPSFGAGEGAGAGAAQTSATAGDGASRGGSATLIPVIFKKLSSFLTLKFDEQVALTGIVSQIACLVATLLTVSSGGDPQAITRPRFDILWRLNHIVETLYGTIQTHLTAQVTYHIISCIIAYKCELYMIYI